MEIRDAKTAREFVASWSKESPRRRANYLCAAREAMQSIAGDAKTPKERRQAQQAATVLARAERAALVEALGFAPEGRADLGQDYLASLGELWVWVKEGVTP